MGAILWKKNKELMNNKKKLFLVFLILVVTMVVLIVNPIELRDTVFGLPVFNSILFWLLLFSIEDFVYAEGVLGTNITIKEMWIGNIIMINLFSFISSVVQSAIILRITNKLGQITFINFFDGISAFVIGLGLVAFATFYISDYSKIRNIVSSVGGIINIAILGYMVVVSGNLNKVYQYRFYVLVISILLSGFSVISVYNFSSSEKFIMNIKNLGQAYDNASNIDE